MKIKYCSGLLAVLLGFQAMANSEIQGIGASALPFGRPMMINTATFFDRNWVFKKDAGIELTGMKRLQLIPGTVLRRIEVRAAGAGKMAIMINDDLASNIITLPNQINEFKTFTFEINKTLPSHQLPLSVRIVFGQEESGASPIPASIRIADVTAIAVDNQLTLNPQGQTHLSQARTGHGSSQCSLEQAVSSYGWVIKRSAQTDSYFNSPMKLFEYVQNNCQGFRFRCEVGALGTRRDGSSAHFGIFVEVRGDWLLATGAYSKNDADERAIQMRNSGFCNY